MKIICSLAVVLLTISCMGQPVLLKNKLKEAGLDSILSKIEQAGLDDRSTALEIYFTDIISKNSSIFHPDFVVRYHNKKDTADIWYRITLNPPDSLSRIKIFDNFFEQQLRTITTIGKGLPFFEMLRVDEKGRKEKAKKVFHADNYNLLGFSPQPAFGNYNGGSYCMIYKKKKALIEIMVTLISQTILSGDYNRWLVFEK
jgi:hypothetical protein